MTKIKIALALSLIAVPSIVFGAGTPPSNVENVTATVTNGTITVSWKTATDAKGIAFYRIYHSRKSILDNGGDYDDFERTKFDETTYTFAKAPISSGTLYLGVLAVNKDGVESEGFETEATVTITPSSSASVQSSVSSSSSSIQAMPVGSNPSTTAKPMTIAGLAPVSSTGILVLFTKPLKNIDFSRGYFVVTDTGGTIVPIVRVMTAGTDMLIHVQPLIGAKTYILTFLNNIPADDGTMMPATTAPARFIAPGMAPTASASSARSSVSSSVMSSVSSVAVSSASSVSSVPQMSSSKSSVYSRFPGQVITNPPVQTPTGTGKNLPDSGIGILGISGLAGALAAGKFRRKKERV